eukprot:56316-Rhodomonas_salina.2
MALRLYSDITRALPVAVLGCTDFCTGDWVATVNLTALRSGRIARYCRGYAPTREISGRGTVQSHSP